MVLPVFCYSLPGRVACRKVLTHISVNGGRLHARAQTFADPILPLLPIDIREKRRAETEKVLWALRERPYGTTSTSSSVFLMLSLSLPLAVSLSLTPPLCIARAVQDLVASLASGGPSQTVPQVRINECLLALARAKVVVKAVVKVRPPPGRFFLVCRSVEA